MVRPSATELTDVRILTLPQMAVAAAQYVGEEPELQKKRLRGGLYAAHTIRMGDFHEWQDLSRWAETSEEYETDYPPQSETYMGGLLEEHLNFVLDWPNEEQQQLDLLLPIRKREGQ